MPIYWPRPFIYSTGSRGWWGDRWGGCSFTFLPWALDDLVLALCAGLCHLLPHHCQPAGGVAEYSCAHSSPSFPIRYCRHERSCWLIEWLCVQSISLIRPPGICLRQLPLTPSFPAVRVGCVKSPSILLPLHSDSSSNFSQSTAAERICCAAA